MILSKYPPSYRSLCDLFPTAALFLSFRDKNSAEPYEAWAGLENTRKNNKNKNKRRKIIFKNSLILEV